MRRLAWHPRLIRKSKTPTTLLTKPITQSRTDNSRQHQQQAAQRQQTKCSKVVFSGPAVRLPLLSDHHSNNSHNSSLLYGYWAAIQNIF